MISDFTGRVAALDQLLADAATSDVILVDGMAGAGKTTLAVRVGHLLADRYPDGRLYIDLHGHSDHDPVDPASALESLLRQLGAAPDRIPDDLDDRAALWRAELSVRRVLVLLDNAATAEQVLPLLAGQPCLVLVTSRRRLAGIDGAAALSLDVLPSAEALELLAKIVGPRATAAPGASAEVARLCGYLPLALRLAAARLASRPAWTVEDLLHRLREAAGSLAELGVSGRTVEAAFRLSYRHLEEPAQRLFRRLGLHPAGDFGEYVAAALADLPLPRTRALLEGLVDAHLLETPAAGRYRMHDLLRDYAASLAEPERDAALSRMCDFYVGATAAATGWFERAGVRSSLTADAQPALRPPLATEDAAATWLDFERPNILAVIALARDLGRHLVVCTLTRAAWMGLCHTGYSGLIPLQRLALESAIAVGDPGLIGAAHNYLAGAIFLRGGYAECLEHTKRALDLRRATGNKLDEATTLGNMAILLGRMGRFREAVTQFEHATDLWQELGAADGVANAQNGVSIVYRELGRYDSALAASRRSAALNRAGGKPIELANSIVELGVIRLRLGQFRLAHLLLHRALTMKTSLDDRFGQAEAINGIGVALRGIGRLPEAIGRHRRALDILTEAEITRGRCAVFNEMAATHAAMGNHADALASYLNALHEARQVTDRTGEARAHHGIGNTLADRDPAAAREHLLAALALYEDMELPERHAVSEKLAGLRGS